MRPFPVDPEAFGTSGEPLVSIPDELGDLASQLRLDGRLQAEVTSQAPVAYPGWQPEPANDLAELLIIVIALNE
jgi:hypothetical protein